MFSQDASGSKVIYKERLTRQIKTRYSYDMHKNNFLKAILMCGLLIIFLPLSLVSITDKDKYYYIRDWVLLKTRRSRAPITPDKDTIKRPPKSLFSLKPTPTPAWETHTHPRLKFEIQYPPGWEADTWDIQDVANVKSTVDGNIWSQTRLSGEDKRLEIIAWGNRAQTPIIQWLTWYRHEDLNLNSLPKETNFIFLGEPSIRLFQEKTSFTYPVVRIFFQKDDKLYEILYRMDSLKGVNQPRDYQLSQEPYITMLQNLKFIP